MQAKIGFLLSFFLLTLPPVMASYFYCRKGYRLAANKTEYLAYLDFMSFLLGSLSFLVFSYVYFYKAEGNILISNTTEFADYFFKNAKFSILILIGTGLGMGIFRRQQILNNIKNNM